MGTRSRHTEPSDGAPSSSEALRQWSLCRLESELLLCAKHRAVQAEDFDRAHAAKLLETSCAERLAAARASFLEVGDGRVVGRLRRLERQKQAAAQNEDYDRAAELKEQQLSLERSLEIEVVNAALALLEDAGTHVLQLTLDPSIAQLSAVADVWNSAADKLRQFVTAADSDVVDRRPSDSGLDPHSAQVERADVFGAHLDKPVLVEDGSSQEELVASGRKVLDSDAAKEAKNKGRQKKTGQNKKGKRPTKEKGKSKKKKKKKKTKDKRKAKKGRKERAKKNSSSSKKTKRRAASTSSDSESPPSASSESSSPSSADPDKLASEFAQAAERGAVAIAQHIVFRHGVDWRSPSGDGPLHIAARANKPALVDFVLRHGFAGGLLGCRNVAGETPLIVAARLHRGRIALRLLEALADPSETDHMGVSAESLDVDGLVQEADRDETSRKSIAGDDLLDKLAAARKEREEAQWRERMFFEEDLDHCGFEGYSDLERNDSGRNDWMDDIAEQVAARVEAEKRARVEELLAAREAARARDNAAKAEARSERRDGPTPFAWERKPSKTSGQRSASAAGAAAQEDIEMDAEARLSARASDEARWNAFQKRLADGSGVLQTTSTASIPWPTGPPQNPVHVDPRGHPAVVRSQLRAGLLRWHPDKFEQRFGRLLPADGVEREAVMSRVKDISQQLTRLMSELAPEATSAREAP